MVDGADAGGQKQPFRRVHGDGGIEDRGARHHEGMAQHLLDLGALVGDAGDGAELAAGNRGRHADLAHRRRVDVRRDALAGADPVDVLDAADIVGKADLHRLGAVGDRAAADRDDEVGVGGAGLLRRRRSRPRAACAPASHRRCRRNVRPARLRIFSISSVSRFSVPLTIRNARLRAEPVHLRDHGLGGRAFRKPPRPWRRKRHVPCACDCPPWRWLVAALENNLAERMRDGEG